MRSPRIWLTLLSLAAVVWILRHDLGERTSPGELGASHGLVAEFKGGGACDTCHGEGPDDLARACGVCHEEVHTDVEKGTGLHGTLGLARGSAKASEVPVEDCGACHVEHHGGNLPAVSERSFNLAGFASQQTFDHARLDLELEGAHANLGCVECHQNAELRSLEEGQLRFHGLDRSCSACHDDPHQGRITWDCQDCHGQELPFAELGGFEHSPAFELVGGHALGDPEDCATCHVPASPQGVEALASVPRGELDSDRMRRCADCHDSPHSPELLRGSDQLAGLLHDEAPGDCSACHDTSPSGFGHGGTDLGTSDRARDLHAFTGFLLEAPHGELDCDACHGPELAEGAPLELSFDLRHPGRTAFDCAACHTDPHAGANGPSCLDCHQPAGPWNDLARFDHHADFALAGVHAQLACTDCHAESGPTSVAQLGRVEALEGPGSNQARSCAACHQDPHRPEFLAGVALRLDAVELPGDTCSSCHGLDNEPAARGGPGFSLAPADLPIDLHAASGFGLTEPHGDLACAGCHGDPAALVPVGGRSDAGRADLSLLVASSPFHARFPGTRQADDCAACHVDPHAGRLAASAMVRQSERDPGPSGCRACHSDGYFQPSLVDDALHAASGFALEGGHAAVGCFACHERSAATAAADSTPRFAGTPTACVACHDDIHEGAFASVDGSCASCHVTSSFHEVAAVAAGTFDHEALCGFALEGAHDRADCKSCHGPEPGWPSARGARDFGRVSILHPGDPTRCATCHADPHDGAFDQPQLPSAIDGRASCARCHDQEGFSMDAGAPFDHGLWTGYALVGPHATTSCGDCHGRLPDTGPSGPHAATRLGKAPGTSCADCHADVHLGQFRDSNPAGTSVTSCESCHGVPTEPEAGWAAPLFDHAAVFALDAKHAALDCAACHRPWPLPDGREVVRYRPLGRDCKDCHGSPAPGSQR
ncbi:MAG: cytochrome c3 family protein [Planctomycetota bacterium]|nr:cytochrome c3 family protein [Planctomycetota bacterium]